MTDLPRYDEKRYTSFYSKRNATSFVVVRDQKSSDVQIETSAYRRVMPKAINETMDGLYMGRRYDREDRA